MIGNMIFFSQVEMVKDILAKYSRVSGRTVNLSKSTISFSPNIPRDINRIASLLQISNINTQDKFLGLPSSVPRSKQQVFSFLKESGFKMFRLKRKASLKRK